jgi:hypothetical protein
MISAHHCHESRRPEPVLKVPIDESLCEGGVAPAEVVGRPVAVGVGIAGGRG